MADYVVVEDEEYWCLTADELQSRMVDAAELVEDRETLERLEKMCAQVEDIVVELATIFARIALENQENRT